MNLSRAVVWVRVRLQTIGEETLKSKVKVRFRDVAPQEHRLSLLLQERNFEHLETSSRASPHASQ
jgi:hypothetical protein